MLIGLVPGKGGAGKRCGDVVVDMELRRRSGRAVVGRFILSSPPAVVEGEPNSKRGGGGSFMFLADHPLFASFDDTQSAVGGQEANIAETTFNLGLTEKQRRDREGIILPYFDAQVDIGAGEGGRILYDMGREDDFDDEDDEI